MQHLIFIAMLLLLVSCAEHTTTKSPEQSLTDTSSKPITVPETTSNKQHTPTTIALTFINTYVTNCNKIKESVDMVEWVNANTLTTNDFKKQVKALVEKAAKEDPELGLDFDPIFNAQDYPDQGFELDTFDSTTNLIVVKGKQWAEFKVPMKVVFVNNQWLVDGCGIINVPKNQQNPK